MSRTTSQNEYFETLVEGGRNEIVDPNAAKLYDDLSLATRSPLLARGRAAAILRLTLGRDDSLIDTTWYQHPSLLPRQLPGRPRELELVNVALPPAPH